MVDKTKQPLNITSRTEVTRISHKNPNKEWKCPEFSVLNIGPGGDFMDQGNITYCPYCGKQLEKEVEE